MAKPWVLADSAALELEQIQSYLDERTGGPSVFDDLADGIDETMEQVCAFPELFDVSILPELAALGYRAFTVGRYVVLYTIKPDCIFVAHVFHGSQDYAKLVL
ncbi:type II toxin-antitoxin system RelE/ParE family toxin [Olsenella sp. YH-ols2217]|uniref:Type II toxin-antitoxin system RelE/ParE family toxin n=1 Tax=Kribbibacterium absianum TaxID=3044210 RepID=A0ABT6ZLG7_9ACTN|nr:MULTISPECIES: type II toxin-antitoxin system RelE/ParE family toxin [unclassified Olsenella]MDJ1122534.1 type II toxin-antitoxin system RelE/ParE family toxin [Olsenella sp. YH-ols2216]MDJ1129506.1 type II toxin-antitoxin system RelE/ParE family toxin [Olsenella sp. YH-ols2217]